MRHRSHIRATFQLNLLGIFHVIEGQKGTHTHTDRHHFPFSMVWILLIVRIIGL